MASRSFGLVVAAGILSSSTAYAGADEREAPWNARMAEHLWNRAGFGANEAEIERAVRMGRQAFVDELVRGESPGELPFYRRLKRGKNRPAAPSQAERGDLFLEQWKSDVDQLADYLAWWVGRMVTGADPLRERMTLFWHGHFTTSSEDVASSHEIILQSQFLRENALGNFRELVHGIARDPAMLEYLDNDESRKESPNENFARELMELFTLGEGNYTEDDVREVARAFTGWTDARGEFRFAERRHDFGEKTVLGVTGALDGDDVIEILLAQEACATFVAGKLLAWFEGVEPREKRVAEYARALREEDFEIAPVLRKLFLDPAFYRSEVVGKRISGPFDYLVGTVRRLGIDPPPRLVVVGGALLGQRLSAPPSVKGWEEGEAWITTAALIYRSNLAGLFLGRLGLDDILPVDSKRRRGSDGNTRRMGRVSHGAPGIAAPNVEEARMASAGVQEPVEASAIKVENLVGLRELKILKRLDWRPRLNLTERMHRLDATKDPEIVKALTDGLLATRVGKETRRELVSLLRAERKEHGVSGPRFLKQPLVAEPILRELAHVVLSLPEAQLH